MNGGKSTNPLNFLEVNSAWGGYVAIVASCLSASLWLEPASNNQSTDPGIWKTGSLLHTWPLKLCASYSRNTCTAVCRRVGMGNGQMLLHQELKLTQINHSLHPSLPLELTSLNRPQSSITLNIRQILAGQLLSRMWRWIPGAFYSAVFPSLILY